jgi:hypothetical protein
MGTIPTYLRLQNNTVHAPTYLCIHALRQLCIAGLEEITGGKPYVSLSFFNEVNAFAATLEQLSQIQNGNVLASFAAYKAAHGM